MRSREQAKAVAVNACRLSCKHTPDDIIEAMSLQTEVTGMRLTVAITGASGAIYAASMLRLLEADTRVARVHLVTSDHSLRVLSEEMGLAGRSDLLPRLLGGTSSKIRQLSNTDVGAPIASGSYPCDGMMVLPCSMGTLASISNGLASNLIARAADVCLKERRRLVLCVREAPFNLVHLRNMQMATEAGAVIFPAIPTLYNRPQTVEEMATQFCCRVLQLFDLPQKGAYQWRADE